MLSRLTFFIGMQDVDNFVQLFFRAGLNVSAPDLKTTDALGTVLNPDVDREPVRQPGRTARIGALA